MSACLTFLRRLCTTLGLLVVIATSSTAQAQPTVPTDSQLELNDRAVEAIVEGNYARAVAQLEEAVLTGGFNILYLNLGRAYQKLGNCEQARAALDKAKSAPEVAEPAPELVQMKADQYLEELDQTCAETTEARDKDRVSSGDNGASDSEPDRKSSGASERDPDAEPDEVAAAEAPVKPSTPGVRQRNPNLFYLELGGHGGAPTLNYERFFIFDYDLLGAELDLGAGVGFGHTEGTIDYGLWQDEGTLTAIPLYASATLLGETHSLLVQSGVTLLKAKFSRTGALGDTQDDQQRGGAFPFLQVGYQMHLDGGFLMRVSVTGAKFLGFVAGLSLGWSF